MPIPKMHPDEVETRVSLVERLLTKQFPQWANLPIEPVASAGTDHALYRLGEDMVVRLPRIDWAIGQAEKEHHWLPVLAPHLPLTIPTPLAKGEPGEGYPYQWSIYKWLEGQNASLADLADINQATIQLAHFILALQQIDTESAPSSGEHNSYRGVPLTQRDAPTRAAIQALQGMIDTEAATAAWESALQTPSWQHAPVWIHGDLQPGNLLAAEGQLHAVIDFGCLAMGDPSCDLIIAWNFLPASTRALFRSSLGVDNATWARGRGWALSIALIQLPYYHQTNPTLAANARHVIQEVLADHQQDSGPLA